MKKFKTYLIGWFILIILIITGVLCSCDKSILEPELELKGTYFMDGIRLNFDNGNITGKTKCNKLYGNYTIVDDSIYIYIGGTKIFCENEFNIHKIRDIERFELTNEQLILINYEYELIFYKL